MSSRFIDQYIQFVDGVTSDDSKNDAAFFSRMKELSDNGLQVARLDTAVTGIGGEAGEIGDLWKKIKFHGKPWNDENRDKMISELGDMFWYLMQACMALGVDPEDIMEKNVAKLEARYPGGKFSIERSENRLA